MYLKSNNITALLVASATFLASLASAAQQNYVFRIYGSQPDSLEDGLGEKYVDQYTGSVRIEEEKMVFRLTNNDRMIAVPGSGFLPYEVGAIVFEERESGIYVGKSHITSELNFLLARSILSKARIADAGETLNEVDHFLFEPPNKLELEKVAVEKEMEGFAYAKYSLSMGYYWKPSDPSLVLRLPMRDLTEEKVREIFEIAENPDLTKSLKLRAFIGVLGEQFWLSTLELSPEPER